VTQVIADLLQRETFGEQIRGPSVAEPMWTVPMERLTQAPLANPDHRREATVEQRPIRPT